MRRRFGFRIMQGGIEVAGGDAPTYEEALREAQHYAFQYAQDGPVVMRVDPPNEPDTNTAVNEEP